MRPGASASLFNPNPAVTLHCIYNTTMGSLNIHEAHDDVENQAYHRPPKTSSIQVSTEAHTNAFPEDTKNLSFDLLGHYESPTVPNSPEILLARWNARIEGLAGLEARGIIRVLPEEKHAGGSRSYLQMFALWFNMNLAGTNIITGLLGVLVFELGWIDCVCIVVFACGLSACAAAYTSTFGPESGNRTMVHTRADTAQSRRRSSFELRY